MKILLFTLVCMGCLVGCKNEPARPAEVRLFTHYFIFGTDTLIVEGTHWNASKMSQAEQWNKVDSVGYYHYFDSICDRPHCEILKVSTTGLTEWTTGDIVYKSKGIGRLPIGAKGQVLPIHNGKPAWTDVSKATRDTMVIIKKECEHDFNWMTLTSLPPITKGTCGKCGFTKEIKGQSQYVLGVDSLGNIFEVKIQPR